MMISGYVGVVIAPGSPWHEIVTVLFGVGMGLTLDEFALWLDLKDVYWAEEGRKSIDAVIVAGDVTGVVLVGFTAWVTWRLRSRTAVFAVVGAVRAARDPASRSVNAGQGEVLVGAVGLADPWPVGLCPRSGWPSRTRSGRGSSTRTTGAGSRATGIRTREPLQGRPRRRPPRVGALALGLGFGLVGALIVVGLAGPDLVDDRAERGRGRDRQQGTEDAGELAADQDRDDRDGRDGSRTAFL